MYQEISDDVLGENKICIIHACFVCTTCWNWIKVMFGLYVVCGNSIKNRRKRLTTGIGNINLMFIRKIKEKRSYSNIKYTYKDSVPVCVTYLSCLPPNNNSKKKTNKKF